MIDEKQLEKKTLNKWGYKKYKYGINKLEIYYRAETSDPKIIDEVLLRNVYQKKKIGFELSKDDVWLDLGCNIGAFALLALSFGAKVICLEPEPENFDMIELNLRKNFVDGQYEILPYAINVKNEISTFYLCKGDYNKSRHTLYYKKGRKSIQVESVTLGQLMNEYPDINCIKMDIEGTEIDILENTDFSAYPNIQKVVFEYSFDIDPSIARFMKIINKLMQNFKTVYYTKVNSNEKEYKYYPPCTNVYCLK